MKAVTSDLSEFGTIELSEAVKILRTFKTSNDKTRLLSDGVELCFNRYYGKVFLSDEDYNAATLDENNILRDFLSCPECGLAGHPNDIIDEHEPLDKLSEGCADFLTSIAEQFKMEMETDDFGTPTRKEK